MTKLAVVGEAWGREEEDAGGEPFVGWAGRLLFGLLREHGVRRQDCHVTNVFNLRPKPSNDVKNLCGPKSTAIAGMPPLFQGKYIREEFQPHLERLYAELRSVQPTLILALGGTATWALLKLPRIMRIRGTPIWSTIIGAKVLGAPHPAAVSRDGKLRPILFADLEKASREQHFPEIRRPRREVWIEPGIADLFEFERRYIDPSPDLSIDIETAGTMITMIGFAPTPQIALVVPFHDYLRPDGNYWRTATEEVAAWQWVQHICSLPKKIVGQNFLYDMGHLWRHNGITVPHMADDTMLLHHSLLPELKKDLGLLGSVYTDEVNWKINRENDTLKRED